MLPKDINPNEGEIIAANSQISAVPTASGELSGGEAIAENYVHSQLLKARKSLLLTQLFSSALVLGTLLYLGYITATLRGSLQPAAAAEIADGIIAEKANEQAQNLAQQTRERVPQLIAGLPDYAIKEMPSYRAQLENQIETDMRTHFASASEQMEAHVDEFLTTNKTQIGLMLKDGQNREATKQLGGALETEFHKFLKETPIDKNNETPQQKLDQTLTSLQQIEKKMAHLAANQDLTPSEKKLRRAIAIMSGNLGKHVKENGLTIAQLPN